MVDKLKSYEDILESALGDRTDTVIPSSGLEHARLGLKYLFIGAAPGDTIRIVSDEFYEGCWRRLKGQMEKYMAEGGKIRVIVLKRKLNDLVKQLASKHEDSFEILRLPAEDDGKVAAEMPHFTVIEPVGYRIELSEKEQESSLVRGVINFGDNDLSQKLSSLFDALAKKIKTTVPAGKSAAGCAST